MKEYKIKSYYYDELNEYARQVALDECINSIKLKLKMSKLLNEIIDKYKPKFNEIHLNGLSIILHLDMMTDSVSAYIKATHRSLSEELLEYYGVDYIKGYEDAVVTISSIGDVIVSDFQDEVTNSELSRKMTIKCKAIYGQLLNELDRFYADAFENGTVAKLLSELKVEFFDNGELFLYEPREW